jgi:hypothetical protein
MALQSTLPHKSTHALGGTDALTPADIGAIPTVSFALGTSSNADSVLSAGTNRILTFETYNFDQDRFLTLPRSTDGAKAGDRLRIRHRAQFHMGGPFRLALRQYEVVAPQGSPQYGSGFVTLATLADGETLDLIANGSTPLQWLPVTTAAVAKSGDTMTGKLTLPASTTASAPLNIPHPATGTDPTFPSSGDLWLNGQLRYSDQTGTTRYVADLNRPNTFQQNQIISAGSSTSAAALRIIQEGTGEALRVEDNSRGVFGITVTAQGSGYTSAPTVTIAAPPSGGTQATATASIAAGKVTAIVVANSGSGYISAPAVTFSGGGGSGAAAQALISPDTTAFVISKTGKVGIGVAPDETVALKLPASTLSSVPLNLGNGVSPTTTVPGDVFSSGNNIFFKGATGGPYIFAYKNDTNTFLVPQIISTVSPTGDPAPALRITQAGGGEAFRVEDNIRAVVSITVTAKGSGYTVAPTVTIAAPPIGGTQATATASISGGKVTEIVVTNSGSGYTTTATPPAVTFSGGGGSGATASAVISPDTTAFVVSTTGRVGVGVSPDATVSLSVDSTGIKFSDGSVQTTVGAPLYDDGSGQVQNTVLQATQLWDNANQAIGLAINDGIVDLGPNAATSNVAANFRTAIGAQAAGDYAPLDDDGLVPVEKLPALLFAPPAPLYQATYYKTTDQSFGANDGSSNEVTFNADAAWNNSNGYITHAPGSKDFVVVQAGMYQLEWNVSVAANGATWNTGNNKVISIDLTRDIGGPLLERAVIGQTAVGATGQDYSQSVCSTFHLQAGDVINLSVFGLYATNVPVIKGIQNEIDLNSWFTWRYIASGATPDLSGYVLNADARLSDARKPLNLGSLILRIDGTANLGNTSNSTEYVFPWNDVYFQEDLSSMAVTPPSPAAERNILLPEAGWYYLEARYTSFDITNPNAFMRIRLRTSDTLITSADAGALRDVVAVGRTGTSLSGEANVRGSLTLKISSPTYCVFTILHDSAPGTGYPVFNNDNGLQPYIYIRRLSI